MKARLQSDTFKTDCDYHTSTRTQLGLISIFLVALCMIFGVSAMARAQVLTADILGTVTDTNGAVLPNAAITITNLGTNDVHLARSSDNGDFTVTLLPVGNYSIKVEVAGFKTYTVSSLALSGGDRARITAALQVGQTTETVQVTTQAPALQTDTSTVSQTVTQASLENLPLNGRNFISLAVLAPGATSGGPNPMSGGNRPDDRRQSSAISVNGEYETMNNYMIDGMDNNERYIGTIGVRPSVDAMQEYSVQTNLYTADVTKTAGGVINIITKSGNNEIHGTLFEYLRNDLFDASANYNFAGGTPIPKGEYRQNQFGGSVGGPIKKDKTFFFADYENLRIIQGIAFTSLVVPTTAEKNGDFSALLSSGTYIYDPALCPSNLTASSPNYAMCHSTGAAGPVFPGNIIPASRIDSTIKNLLTLIPNPTSGAIGTVNFQDDVNRTQFQHTFDVRIDHHIGDKDMIFGRYSFNNTNTFTPNAFPLVNGITGGGCNCASSNGQSSTTAGSFSGPAKQRDQNTQINYSHVFTPALLLEARLGWLRTATNSLPDNQSNAPNAATKMGIPNVNVGSIFSQGLPQMTLAPYASLGDQLFLPEMVFDNTYQWNNDVRYTKGSHALATGFSFIRRYVYLNQAQQGRGWWLFNSTAPSGYTVGTNDAFADFLLDMPQTFTRNLPLVTFGSIGDEWGAYVQDDWRVTRNLTLNLGGRWDVYMPFAARHGYMANWSTNLNQLLMPGQTSGVNDRANVPVDYKDFVPRVGFADTILPGLVVRGGFGMTFYTGLTSNFPYLENVPYYFASNGNCGVGQSAPCPTLLQGSPAPPSSVNYALAQNANITGTIYGMSPTFRNPYVEQWSLNVEKDFHGNVIGVRYVGSGTHEQPVQVNMNMGTAPSFSSSVTVPRPLTTAGVFYNATTNTNNSPTVNVQRNILSSNYNSMQFTVDRRTQRGLTINGQYTFAKSLSENGSTQSISSGGGLQWIANPHFDYGRTGLDVRHHLAMLVNYELPFAREMSGPLGYALKGWQVNTVYQFSSGLPLTVVNPSNRLNIVGGGADRPNVVAPVTYPHQLKQWFSTSSFASNTLGFPGNEQIYSVNGPHFRQWDLSAVKLFPIAERYNLQFRAEGFNILNMANFGNPGATLGAATDGQITTLLGAPRQFQFALKLLF